MPRKARGIEIDTEGLYHLRGLVAGPRGYAPLKNKENARQLVAIVEYYVERFFCEQASLEVMPTHYHSSCRFEAYRELSQEELQECAERFYPGRYRPYLKWGPKQWARFNRRLFNPSEFMRNIQQAFSRWYNVRYGRRGPFWAGRFRSTDTQNLQETTFYIELNAVRAGLVSRPEHWRYSSAWMRKHGQDGWLMPLEQLMGTSDRAEAERLYWLGLYWRGTRPSKETDAVMPEEFVLQLAKSQLERGCYLQHNDYFSRGPSRKAGED